MTRQVKLTGTQRILLIALYKKEKGMNRDELGTLTGIARTTIFDNLKKLEALKVVSRNRKGNGKVGASQTLWKIGKEGW